MDRWDFLTLVASAESNSEHPLAKAIVEYARHFHFFDDPSATKGSISLRKEYKSPGWLLEVGIVDVREEVLPTGKADVILSFQNDGCIVAMVGDGINDFPALAAAGVGMTIGVWTDIAIVAISVL